MSVRKILAAVAALGVLAAPGVLAAAPDAQEQPVEALQAQILANVSTTPGDQQAVMAAITNSTAGWPLDVITQAVCPLGSANLAAIYGEDQNAIANANATRTRPEVRAAIAESCSVAQLAMASYGSTGGVAAGPAPGQAFGSGSVGAPGGGGGSGYTTN